MRRTTITTTLLALALSSSPALADDDSDESPSYGGMLEVGGFLGGFFPSSDHEFYDPTLTPPMELGSGGVAFGARVGFLPIPFLGVEAELDWSSQEAEDGEGVSLLGFRGHLIGQYPGRIAPFAVLGLGPMSSSAPDTTLGDDTDLLGHLGLGAKFWATEALAVRLDARLYFGPKAEPITADGDATSHYAVYLGASYAFDFSDDEVVEEADPDPDGDGILGDADQCPHEAGEPPDGCPVRDRDGDGIMDDADECPGEAENMNNFEDEDGCPETIPDSDGDGFDDVTDKCPHLEEDVDGFEDEDGCPDDDNDGDGVSDAQDGCRDEVGPVENRGCPDTDRDGDGVVDRSDNCPDEMGTIENQGCKKKQLVVLTQTQLKILDKVYFATNKARIRSKSRRLLNNVADVLQAHPEIKKIRVEGHTDNSGDPERNKVLSQERADAVVEYLVKKGVSIDRLEAIGHGQDRPIADNSTKEGMAENRRVEFNIPETVQ